MNLKQYEARKIARSNENLREICQSDKYWWVSPAQLARDLKGYRFRHTVPGFGKYVPRTGYDNLKWEYLAWCKARGHKPHPASIDRGHPMHANQRERCPRCEP